MKYDHVVISDHYAEGSRGGFITRMQQMGAEGWELVSTVLVYHGNVGCERYYYDLFYKRRMKAAKR